MASFLWFILGVAAMAISRDKLDLHIHRLAYLISRSERSSLIVFVIFYLPGVVVHEISHWILARLLFVKTHGISLLPRVGAGGSVQLGHVRVERTDVLRASLIGLAPTLAGGGILLWVLWPQLNAAELAKALQTFDWRLAGQALGDVISNGQAVLWLYLSLAVGNRMLPSRADRSAWFGMLVVMLALGLLLVILGLGEVASGALGAFIQPLAAIMGGISTGVAVLNVLLLIPLSLIYLLLKRLLGEP